MKIIAVDNFDRDTHSDTLVLDNVNKYYGEIIVEHLNDKLSGDYALDFYRLVEDDYKLYEFEV